MRLRPRHSLAIAACLVSAIAAAPSGAAAAVQRCDTTINIRNRLAAVATVLSTRGTTCRRARNLIRNRGNFFAPTDVGDRFMIRDFRCKVYFSLEESHRARCITETKAFRVDYGS